MYLTVGISASGKSSWAKTNPVPNAVYITRDDIRFNFIKPGQTWADYKFNKENEEVVSNIQKSIAEQAVIAKKNIVIVDTNLSSRVRDYWKDFSTKIGYDFEIISFDCSFEEAVKRDNLRANGVGQSVIRNQYKNYLEYSGFKFYVPDETKPDCIVVDIDGTVAQMHDRSAFEWDKVENDKSRQFVIDLILAYAEKHKCKIVFLSSRDHIFDRSFYSGEIVYEDINADISDSLKKDFSSIRTSSDVYDISDIHSWILMNLISKYNKYVKNM